MAIVPRDTTITQYNALTRLSLDSISVRKYIDSTISDSPTAADVINFYNSRNYQYAWFNEEGLSAQAEAFLNLTGMQQAFPSDNNFVRPAFNSRMDSLLNEDISAISARDRQDIELSLTSQFIRYVRDPVYGRVKPEDIKWYIPVKKTDPLTVLDSLFNGNKKGWLPLGQGYMRMRNKLKAYAAITRAGGWPVITMSISQLKKGMSDSLVTVIKKRLQLTGDGDRDDTSRIFDTTFERRIRDQQRRYGLPVTGVIDKELIEELNVSAENRIRQIIVNLERMKWMPTEDSVYILANIPEYRLKFFKKDSIALDMRIVVGRAANHTVIFSDSLKYIVFSPYWNVPPSIVKNEILPAMRRDKNYLRRNNMEITGNAGGVPVIRQKPGAGNALGAVKFLFPNRFNIYFHDTPAKGLFEKPGRAFSHGCIRLQKPFDLAALLLKGVSGWDDSAIRKAMHRNTEKWVTLKQSIPVYIVYFTSWVDEEGLLHFAKDIYGHDKVLADHLFTK